MKRLVQAIVAAIALSASAAGAQTPADNCMSTYYRDKSDACLNQTLDALRLQTAANPQINFAMVGFLAGVIKSSPEPVETRIAAADGPPAMKLTIMLALNRAGANAMARSLAQTEQLQAAWRAIDNQPQPPLADVKPRSVPGDNDLMIGAFMATGDPAYIKAILGNFTDAQDDVIHDAVRLGLMQPKFSKNDLRGGFHRMAHAGCDKYQCKRDLSAFMRVMTLSSAYWALNSLASTDETIRRTSQEFLDADPRIKAIIATEREAFANYLTDAVAWTILKDRPDLKAHAVFDDAMTQYENLGPATAMLTPLSLDQK